MKEYELIIEIQQPPCGGKDSKKTEVIEIETDDPMGYVKKLEPKVPDEFITMETSGNDIIIEIHYERFHGKYTFSEF